jgi:hypothetical protein
MVKSKLAILALFPAFLVLHKLQFVRAQSTHRQQSRQPQQSQSKNSDPYKILGVKRNAKDKEIKSAYRKLALKYHVSLIEVCSLFEKRENHYMSIVCYEVQLDAMCIMF